MLRGFDCFLFCLLISSVLQRCTVYRHYNFLFTYLFFPYPSFLDLILPSCYLIGFALAVGVKYVCLPPPNHQDAPLVDYPCFLSYQKYALAYAAMSQSPQTHQIFIAYFASLYALLVPSCNNEMNHRHTVIFEPSWISLSLDLIPGK